MSDGKQLRLDNFTNGSLSVHHPILVTDVPVGIKVPETMSVRHVADLVGHSTPVNVMDVEYQEGTFGLLGRRVVAIVMLVTSRSAAFGTVTAPLVVDSISLVSVPRLLRTRGMDFRRFGRVL